MAKPFISLRGKLDKLLFSGLKPDQPLRRKKKPKIDELLEEESLIFAGLKPEDKSLPGPASIWKRVAATFGALIVAGSLGTLAYFLSRTAERPETAAGPSHRIIFELPPNFRIDKNQDLDVSEIVFQHDRQPYFISGKVKNKTGRHFKRCEISFDVTTADGGRLGGVVTMIKDLGPHETTDFRIPVPQKNAALTMVRELRAE